MPKFTYLQSILQYFTQMNIDQLRCLLKEEYTYQETTKEIFLNEIESIFEALRNSGDTELLLYTGICAGKTCDNCGKKGYRFVGNHSKNYLDLIFEMNGDDITDIYCCAEFKSNTEISGLGNCTSVYINFDDRVSYPKSPEYWALVYAAQDAYNELVTTPPRKLNFDEVEYWMDKHAELYSRLGGFHLLTPRMRWTPYLMLYSDLSELVSFITENLDEIRQANQSVKDLKTEEELIDWVLKYETVYEKGTFDLRCGTENKEEEFCFKKDTPYSFKGAIFYETFHFFETYRNYFEPFLDKYSIYTRKEESELYNDENSGVDIDDLYSLRFHIKRRKELEKIGVNLPFYL
jgi:hypothetical protein